MVAVGCSSDPSITGSGPGAGSVVVTSTGLSPASLLSTEGNFVLSVSNQSLEVNSVDIRVEVDGQLVCGGDFESGNLHQYQRFVLALGPGTHWLRATSVVGSASLLEYFQVTGNHWAVVWYRDAPGNGGPADKGGFAFRLSDSPIGIK